MSLHKIATQTYVQMLESMQTVLDKGSDHCAAHKIEESALLNFRLYPDMYPFVRQVQSTADHASGPCQRVAGLEVVRPPREETSFDALKQRIADALSVVQSVDARAIDANADRELFIPMGSRTLKMTGWDYIRSYALPNFYFHHTTSYAILRHNGVVVGKRDFLGAMPGTQE